MWIEQARRHAKSSQSTWKLHKAATVLKPARRAVNLVNASSACRKAKSVFSYISNYGTIENQVIGAWRYFRGIASKAHAIGPDLQE